jgi:sugar phosphate isomerase/epimerase
MTMKRLSVGVRLESLGLPFRRALAEASRLGVTGVQLDAVGELSPQQLGETARRDLLRLLRSHNLELTALGCPLRYGLAERENQQPRIEHVRRVMTLAFELSPRLVVVEAGAIPPAEDLTRTSLMTDALTDLARYGDRIGTTLALETGLESGAVLRAFLARFDTGSLGVNLDPANLLLHDFDPYAAARDLRGHVVHAHARDARVSGASRRAAEVPVGHGDIDWLRFLGVLEEIEYRGWLVVERETGDNRLADLTAGVSFLRRLIG